MKENFFSSPFFHQKSQLLLFYPFTREETKYPKSQQHIKQDFHNFAFRISQAEKLLGNFDVSIKNLYDALEYATPTNKELNGQIYALIGALYCKLTDYNKAIEMSEKAISIFKSIATAPR